MSLCCGILKPSQMVVKYLELYPSCGGWWFRDPVENASFMCQDLPKILDHLYGYISL